MKAIWKAMIFAIVFFQQLYTSSHNNDSRSDEPNDEGMLRNYERKMWLSNSQGYAAVNLDRLELTNKQKDGNEQPSFDCDDCKTLLDRFGIGCIGCMPCVFCAAVFFGLIKH